MSGGNTSVDKSVGNGFGMLDVDAIANGGFVRSKLNVIVDNAADNGSSRHDFF